MESIHGTGQRWHLSPSAPEISRRGSLRKAGRGGVGDLADAGRVGLVVVFVEDVDEAIEADAFEAGELVVVVVGIEEAGKKVARHRADLGVVHVAVVDGPEGETGRAFGGVAEARKEKPIAASEEEGEEQARGAEGLDRAPSAAAQIEGGDGAGVDPEHVEESPA